MILSTHFISCDWGTTNFRLRLVTSDSLTVLAEHTTDLGVRILNEQFTQGGGADRLTFFATYLRTQLANLPSVHDGAPIVISGMASANIGMRDLAYGDLPIGPGATSFVFEDITPWPNQLVRLISGIKSATGMMRGEEIQALGLLEIMGKSKDGVLLLPGTHSKHLTFKNGQFTDFTSFMTGELFEIISQKSILANSVAPGEWNARTGDCFREGVLTGYNSGFSSNLFAIRAGQILRQTDAKDNFYQLSGLLIGDELAHLPEEKSKEIYLAGSGPLLRLYRYALEILGNGDRLTVFDEKILGEALLSGQREILMREHSIKPGT
jgi:2-dehydro-3-deoxygalactonokinase